VQVNTNPVTKEVCTVLLPETFIAPLTRASIEEVLKACQPGCTFLKRLLELECDSASVSTSSCSMQLSSIVAVIAKSVRLDLSGGFFINIGLVYGYVCLERIKSKFIGFKPRFKQLSTGTLNNLF
jgi:hypothetical protein